MFFHRLQMIPVCRKCLKSTAKLQIATSNVLKADWFSMGV